MRDVSSAGREHPQIVGVVLPPVSRRAMAACVASGLAKLGFGVVDRPDCEGVTAADHQSRVADLDEPLALRARDAEFRHMIDLVALGAWLSCRTCDLVDAHATTLGRCAGALEAMSPNVHSAVGHPVLAAQPEAGIERGSMTSRAMF